MRPMQTGIVFLFLSSLLPPAFGAEHTGLWVGSATLNEVSQVVSGASDLLFDAGLTHSTEEDTLVAQGSVWGYSDTGTLPSPRWNALSYDYSPWPGGPAPLGFGTATTTTVSYGSDGDNKYITTYFLHRFQPPREPSLYQGLRLQLNLLSGNGAVIYLNGIEIRRDNLPVNAAVDFDTTAVIQVPAAEASSAVPVTLLRPGENLLAVEVHLPSPSAPALSFDLRFTGTVRSSTTTRMSLDSWRIKDDGEIAGIDWREPGYDTSSWQTGTPPFIYTGGEAAVRPTIYFRTEFEVTSEAQRSGVRLYYRRDDGLVLYLNGKEQLRSNMPAGLIEYETSPISVLTSSEAEAWLTYDIAPEDLVVGSNLIAAELHQHPAELSSNTVQTAFTPTPAELSQRLLIHVDDAGTPRLLKEAVFMYDESSAQLILITDHEKLENPAYTGVGWRDGVAVGQRVTAVGFDFGTESEDPAHPGCLPMSGAVENGSLIATFTIQAEHPTNPFLHRYHPDHDNWDARYENTIPEAYEISRSLELDFSGSYPPGWDEASGAVRPPAPLGWGESSLGGMYTETITGLHRDPIQVRGPFLLLRATPIGILNP